MTKRAVLYARVSTDEQADKGYSLPTQVEAMRKYAGEHGYTIAAELRDDCSGTIRMADRPQGSIMVALLERKEADVVIVYTSDRLSRNLAHSLILREGWQRAGVELHYVNRGKSEDTAEGRLTENIEGVIAEYEREKIRERTQRGRHAKAEAGKWVGVGWTYYGFRREGERQTVRLVIDADEARIVRRIFDMYLGRNGYEAKNLLEIARQLTNERIPSPMRAMKHSRGWWMETVRRILTRRAYLGLIEWGGHTINLPEVAIIDQETFEAAQKRIERNKELAKRNRKQEYLLSGCLRCVCGATMSGYTCEGKRYLYYRCRAACNNRHLTICREKTIRADKADALVWEWLMGLLCDEAKLTKGLREMRERREDERQPKRERLGAASELVTKKEAAINRLAQAIGRAEDETSAAALEAQMKATSRERAALIAEHDMLTAELASGALTDEDETAIFALAEVIRKRLTDEPTFEEKRRLLDILNVRVTLQHTTDDQRALYVTCGLNLTGQAVSIEPRTS